MQNIDAFTEKICKRFIAGTHPFEKSERKTKTDWVINDKVYYMTHKKKTSSVLSEEKKSIQDLLASKD